MSLISKKPTLPTNRNFGLLFALIFLICSIYFFSINKYVYVTIFTVFTFVFSILAIFSPKSLASLNKAWFLLGILLGRVVSPLVLSAIFFLIISPVAIISRILGRDILLLRRRSIRTYWIERQPLDSDSFKNQF